MGWMTPDQYFAQHVLPQASYEEVKAMLAKEAAGESQMTGFERMHQRDESDRGSLGNMIDHYGYEQTLAFLDQAQARLEEQAAARATARAAAPPTVGLAERAVWVVMQLSDNYSDLKRRQGEDGDDGPAQLFRRGFDPSITFQEARLDLTPEMIGALAEMRDALAADGFFAVCRDQHLEEDAQILIDKLKGRLEQSVAQPA